MDCRFFLTQLYFLFIMTVTLWVKFIVHDSLIEQKQLVKQKIQKFSKNNNDNLKLRMYHQLPFYRISVVTPVYRNLVINNHGNGSEGQWMYLSRLVTLIQVINEHAPFPLEQMGEVHYRPSDPTGLDRYQLYYPVVSQVIRAPCSNCLAHRQGQVSYPSLNHLEDS